MKQSDCLRVALIGGYFPDSTHMRGGVQAATTHLIKGLARIDGLELHVLTFRPSGWTGPDCLDQNGVCIHLLSPYPRFERLRRYRTLQKAVVGALAQIQPAVVHAQEAGADAYVALHSCFPTVITAHGIKREDAKYCVSLRRRLRFYMDVILTELPVMRRTTHLIANSHYVTTYFSGTLRPDAHLYFISNAVDELFFQPNFHSMHVISGQTTTQPIVLFAGRVTALKRVLDLVQAFKQVVRLAPDAQLHIAGECATEPSYAAIVQNYILQAGLSKQVQLLGEINQEDILSEYRACTIVVLPSAQENAPMVLAQAMASGKPVVATRVGGVPEMVGENEERGLLVGAGDIESLARAMVRLLQDTSLSARLGQAGHVFALENYHIDKVAQRTFEVYQAIAAERSSHA